MPRERIAIAPNGRASRFSARPAETLAGAAEVLTIRNDAGGTIVTPTQAEAAMVWCDGVRWYGMVGAQS